MSVPTIALSAAISPRATYVRHVLTAGAGQISNTQRLHVFGANGQSPSRTIIIYTAVNNTMRLCLQKV
mgnify:CR=1 FL=1